MQWHDTLVLASFLLAALLHQAATDPIAVAAIGLNAQIEDDVRPGGDIGLVSLKTDGCRTVMVGTTRSWTIDWTNADAVGLGDTFVFVSAPPEKFAIVGDASIADQAAKLAALSISMQDAMKRCKVPNKASRAE